MRRNSGKNDNIEDESEMDLTTEDENNKKIRKLINYQKATFKMSTMDFLLNDLLCKCCWPKNSLRNSVTNRKILNYRIGEEKLNKELDIGHILYKLR